MPGTSGALSVTSGVGVDPRALLAVLAVVLLNCFVNTATVLDDARRAGLPMPLGRAVFLETSSAVAALASMWVVVAALRLAPPGRGPLWRTLGVHAAGTVAYSGLHVTLMVLFRMLGAWAAGIAYRWNWNEAPYEYRKDLLAYLVVGGIIWLFARMRQQSRQAAEARAAALAAPGAGTPATFDIRDGTAIVRAPVSEILAVQAAGNYVEFALEDGRRPLMRASMAQVEAALAPAGFVRTHRSWLVNGARVRTLAPAGSGDFRVELGCGVTAPLSRRYPAALARLRDGAAAG